MSLSVLGCVVNGPGEARETDIGITGGGNGKHMVYLSRRDRPPRRRDEAMIDHIVRLVEAKGRRDRRGRGHRVRSPRPACRSCRVIRASVAACLALALSACAGGPAPTTAEAPAHPEARVYDVRPDAMADVDAALTRAATNGKRVLLVMGANWCHDSRTLAGWLETPRLTALVAEQYELVFVNVGMPQSGDGHNLDIARRFGLTEFPGTPAVLVLTGDGQLVNPDTATSWRNAASRSEDAIYAELAALAGRPFPLITDRQHR